MVRHIVIFTLKGTPEERLELSRSFRDALVKLPGVIPCLKSIEVGINENPAEKSDVVLTATVPTMADVAAYATHPAHVAAAGLLKGHVENRSCVDYAVE